MKNHYQFCPQLVLRTPAQPFTVDFNAATTQASLTNERFMEAVYLASPALHDECQKWQQGELTDTRKVAKLTGTLTRYWARLTSRCTPFGLFAGCSVVRWGAASNIRLAPAHNARHTRLDMHYLCALAQQFTGHPAIRPHLRYWPNTSLYRTRDELRYIEYHYVGALRVHQINAVATSPPLLAVLAAAPAGPTLPALVALLNPNKEDQQAAAEFINELIEAQVLVSELEPTVTGVEFFAHIQAVLTRLSTTAPDAAIDAIRATLAEIDHQLSALDHPSPNPAAAYERIVATLAPLGVPLEPSKLFQTDAVQGLTPHTPATLSNHLQVELLAALDVLAYLTPPHHNGRLADFTQRFQVRYEEQEVPLLEALDNESGLSYSDYGKSRYSPFIHDLVVDAPTASPRTLRHTDVQHFMYHKLREAERNRAYSIDITVAALQVQGFAPIAKPLPPSLAIMFRPIDGERVLLESVGGSSAVNLLGRFAHADSAIEELVQQITHLEQVHNPHVAFTEICHLPASRTGNLLLRPCFRSLEIPYLAQSTRPPDAQVHVQDLRLSIRHGQFVLRSHKTNQVIIPRLSTAHNFTGDALPVYQFLCDLQTQGLQPNLGFSWHSVSLYAKFTPRLTSGNVVLAAAAWQFDQADLQPLLAAPPAEYAQRVANFRAQWQLPRFFTLTDGDNELFIDADNEFLVRLWLEAIRNQTTVKLKEFLFDPATSPVRDAADRPYVPQLIALLVRNTPCYPALQAVAAPVEPVQRDFSLGSEWLYYKLYCGQLVADQVLLNVIRPLTAELQAQGLVDTWFFIRYADPDNHLRVRWHLPNPSQVGTIIQLISHYLQDFTGSQAVWKVQADTYRRELERYGTRTIAYSERLFCYQSTALLDYMAATEPAQEELWQWGLGAINELLTAFGYSLDRRVDFFQRLQQSFAQEFGLSKTLKRQLDTKYRHNRAAIDQLLVSTVPRTVPAPLARIVQAIGALDQLAPLEVPLDQLLGSYIHMLLNRLFPADARLHELVLYDFLHRHYESRQARQRKSTISCPP